MSAYPTDPAPSNGSELTPVTGKTVEFAEDGTPRARVLFGETAYRLKLPYNVISSTELGYLKTHWAANLAATFAVTYNSVGYTMQYDDPGLEWSHLGGDWYRATAYLMGQVT